MTENPHVTTGLSVDNIRWAFSSFWVGHWAPPTWLWFGIVLVPVIGLCIPVAWGACELRWRRSVALIGWIAAIGLAVMARHQLHYWRSSHELLSHALSVINDGPELHIQLAQLDLREGNKSAAKQEYETALQIDPTNAAAEFDLGNLLLDDPAVAIRHVQRAVELGPHWTQAKNNLAIAWIRTGRKDLAFTILQQAVLDDPADADAHANLGMLLLEAGQSTAALREFNLSLAVDPANKTAVAGRQAMGQH